MILNDDQLRDLAGDQAFNRGLRYAKEGRVTVERRTATAVSAVVAGTENYVVRLTQSGTEYEWNCSCPAAEGDGFCKHLVAVAIAVRDAPDPSIPAEQAGSDRSLSLHQFLRTQTVDKLAEWLIELAETHSAVGKHLRLLQAQSDPQSLKKALTAILSARNFLDWRASTQFARNLDPAVQALAAAASMNPTQGEELYEYGLSRLLKIYGNSDDSGGAIGDRVRDVVAGYRVCLAQAPTNDAERGKRFLKLQRLDQWDFLSLPVFWSLLGTSAQRTYAAVVEADYAALPAPVNDQPRSERWSSEFPIVDRMERLAEMRGDIDLRIGIIARDLTSGHSYERIIEICRKAGRSREATQWAERGYRHHPNWRGMRVLLAAEYQRAGLSNEALQLLWENFSHRPEAVSWQCLKEAADSHWPEWRERALAQVMQGERQREDGRRDVSSRITLLLADGDIETACTLAEEHAASPTVLERLALAVSKIRPAAAAGFLKRVIDVSLPNADARHYASWVVQIRTVMELDPSSETRAWIAGLRDRYRARRKFISLLEEATTAAAAKRPPGRLR